MYLFKNVKFVEKKHHDDNPYECTKSNLEFAKESFRIHYFLYIVDQTIDSLNRRFEQYNTYKEIFRSLFSIKRLKSFPDQDLKLCCNHLETYLKHDNRYDLDGKILFQELKVIREILTIKSKSNI
ncbi:hypothetical protein CR513_10495, partial [Mucuna pruriens]